MERLAARESAPARAPPPPHPLCVFERVSGLSLSLSISLPPSPLHSDSHSLTHSLSLTRTPAHIQARTHTRERGSPPVLASPPPTPPVCEREGKSLSVRWVNSRWRRATLRLSLSLPLSLSLSLSLNVYIHRCIHGYTCSICMSVCVCTCVQSSGVGVHRRTRASNDDAVSCSTALLLSQPVSLSLHLSFSLSLTMCVHACMHLL